MCGRFNNQIASYGEWADLLRELPEYVASYNVSPSMTIPVITSETGRLMRWGLVPNWSKSFNTKFATFNARIETVKEKPTFKGAWHNKQRCIIPMAGYYEWSMKNGRKLPSYISSGSNIIVAAGLFEHWGSEPNYSCTMLTMPATKALQSIHHRMPILLSPLQAKHWLDGLQRADKSLLTSSPILRSHTVSQLVGDSRQDNAELIKPYDRRDLFD
ncbi:MAG: SOS response-associated peptidase [Gammaproteobacteria bacterium]|nr:SOS response-associated peptidase [Gammaproteobacteria bacterium]